MAWNVAKALASQDSAEKGCSVTLPEYVPNYVEWRSITPEGENKVDGQS